MINEAWLPIVGYEGLYEVSNIGNIRSVFTEATDSLGRKKKHTPRVLKKTKTSTGYYKVELYKPGERRKSHKVHRLVLKAFAEAVEGKDICNHKDGNPLNNNINNLEWCTQAENIIHAVQTGLRRLKLSGEQQKMVCLMYKKRTKTSTELANLFNVSKDAIYLALKRNGVKMLTVSEAQDKYGIDLNALANDFRKGFRNRDLMKKYNCSRGIISTRKYQFKERGII